jgi:hypothetical protein
MRITEQSFGFGSKLDPDLIGSADPDPDRPKISPQKGKNGKKFMFEKALFGSRRQNDF